MFIDNRKEVAIVGAIPEAHGEDIVAMGTYYLDLKTNRAEVAFAVRDNWQSMGIGKFLLNLLCDIAKSSAIAGFTAEVLAENRRMQAVFNNSGMDVKSLLREGVYSFKIDFS